MRVKTRALIVIGDRIAVAVERRAGSRTLTLPGGRPARGETLERAVAREVLEEMGLEVTVGPLLYVAQVVAGSTVQELNLLFLADVVGGDVAAVLTVGPGDDDCAEVMPPVLDAIFSDLGDQWPSGPRFLGNVYVSGRTP